ncbi:MAG: nuclear transport factor 2 family protein [Pseudomonadota bacterium]
MKLLAVSALAVSTVLMTGCEQPDSAPTSVINDAVAETDSQSDQTLAIAQQFLGAAGSGDMETLSRLMANDFVWHNEGDSDVPWIGTWEGKDVVLNEFLPKFGAGLAVTGWATDYSFSNGDQAAFMGTMSADANNTGKSTGTMNWAVRVHVVDGQVKRWTWLEDSYAVSKAYRSE